MNEIIYGIHTVCMFCKQSPERLQKIFISKREKNKYLISLISTVKNKGIMVQCVTRRYLDKKSCGGVHQGIVALVKSKLQYQENDLFNLLPTLENPFLLILDCITDPHNFGACIRSANAAGVNAIIVPRSRSAQLNATAKKVACGAAESVPLIRVTNLVRTIQFLQEQKIWILGTTEKAKLTLYQVQMTGPIAIIIGSEGKGMRHLTYKYCDSLISIPTVGNISSLNVSVATGIFLFEVIRQRGNNK